MTPPKIFVAAAGSLTNRTTDFLLVYSRDDTKTKPILLSQGQAYTVPTGGAVVLQGTLEDLRGYF